MAKKAYVRVIGGLKRVVQKVAGAVQLNNPAAYGLTGLRNPRRRTSDNWDDKHARLLSQIETARTRNAWVQRAVAYYDEIPLGTGLDMQCDDDSVMQVARKIWQLNNFDELQHQLAIELHTTANNFVHIPSLKKANEKLEEGQEKYTIPAITLIPTCQIARIAMKDGKPFYYRRVWTQVIDPEPKVGETEGIPSDTPTTKDMYEDIPANEIVHIRINCAAGEVRGTSQLQAGFHWARQYARILDLSWGAALARSMYNLWAKITGGKKEAENFVDLISDNLVEVTDPDGNVYEVMPPGQIMVTNKDVELSTLSSDLRAGTDDQQTRRVLLAFAVSQGIPEVLLSDGDSANLASSMTQASPFFKIMEQRQTILINGIKRIFMMAFDRLKDDLGVFPEPQLDEGQNHIVDKINFTGPDIMSRDISTVGPAVNTLVQGKIMSREEAAARLGNRWDKIAEQINQEAADGFESTPPSNTPPGGDRPFPFMRLIRAGADPAVDPQNNPRHAETYAAMKKIRGTMRTTVDEYKKELLAAGNDRGRQQEALEAYITKTVNLMADLGQRAEKMGRESINE